MLCRVSALKAHERIWIVSILVESRQEMCDRKECDGLRARDAKSSLWERRQVEASDVDMVTLFRPDVARSKRDSMSAHGGSYSAVGTHGQECYAGRGS